MEELNAWPSDGSVSTTHHDGVPVVSVVGEVDICTAPPVAAEIAAQLNRSPVALVVDLCDVSFFDSSGVNALLDAHRRAADGGVRLHLVAVRPIVLKTLRVTGVDALFSVHATLPDALHTICPSPR